MGLFSHFLKPRVSVEDAAPNTYVKGIIFDPGAEVFAYEPTTTTTPDFITRVFPQWNFTPLEVTQPEMNLQLLSLPANGPQGFPFGGIQPTGLIDSSSYPDVEGDYYQ